MAGVMVVMGEAPGHRNREINELIISAWITIERIRRCRALTQNPQLLRELVSAEHSTVVLVGRIAVLDPHRPR